LDEIGGAWRSLEELGGAWRSLEELGGVQLRAPIVSEDECTSRMKVVVEISEKLHFSA
jgi:hypothetical protein